MVMCPVETSGKYFIRTVFFSKLWETPCCCIKLNENFYYVASPSVKRLDYLTVKK